MSDIKIGEFVKEHIGNIIKYCEEISGELHTLEDKEYSKEKFDISYSFFKKVLEIDREDEGINNKTKTASYRYWKDEYSINNEKYRVCSQWYRKNIKGFLAYLNEKQIFLNKYKNLEMESQQFYSEIENKKFIQTKNIILYGSPGVGKTHNINKLIRLIEDENSDSEIFKSIKTNEHSNSIDISDIKERIKFITFHQSFGYENFIEGFRPNEDGNIKLEDGIFKEISIKASKNITKSFNLDKLVFDDAFELLLKERIENSETVKIDLKNDNSFYEIYDFNQKSIYYTRQGRSSEEKYHTLSVETLKSMYEVENCENITGGLKTYYRPLLKKILEIGKERKVEKTEQKNYYLVIDEINRGNISKIFGELITLIEEDKRDKLEVTLPYSKESFTIPSNLYIIGTMNSTDKSIALIDIALRRRFTFLKMKPNIELVPTESRELFKNLNEYIFKTLGEDYQIGHSYFMGGHDLDFILEYKIKPLLEEYFYGDDKSLKEVLDLISND